MAGDWIKMRVDLGTSPKVVRMASALRADRLRVVGALHAVWSLFDVHSTDGRLDGYSADTVDDLIGFPGFGAAMIAVGWLEDCGDALCTPRFDEHNGQSAKRRAQETERKREARKTSASDADKLRSREEKRRDISSTDVEDKRAARARPASRPDDVPEKVWADFLAIRKAKKAPLTATALDGIEREARKAGISLAQALAECCSRGWQGFKAEWLANAQQGGRAQSAGETSYQRSMRERAAEFAPLAARPDPTNHDDPFHGLDVVDMVAAPSLPALAGNA